MRAFGLAYEDLIVDNPRLVMLSISGFGQDGPAADRPAYAGVVHAESGLLVRQASHSGGPVADLQLSLADVNAGLHGLVAVLAALRLRDHSGVGQHIDLAMNEAMMVSDDYLHWVFDGREPPSGGAEVWQTGAGQIVIHGPFKWVWNRIHARLSVDDPAPAGSGLAEKIKLRRAAVVSLLARCTTWPEVAANLDRANLPWGRVLDSAQSVEAAAVAARGSIVEIDDRIGGTRSIVQSPYRFSACESGVTGPAPLRGEHNVEVLREWIGLDDLRIDGLIADGALLDDQPGGEATP